LVNQLVSSFVIIMSPILQALQSLDGLSIGDAFGQCFLHIKNPDSDILEQRLPQPPWYYTDDTVMALSVVSILARFGIIEQNQLAESLAQHYDYNRAYGPSMHRVLGRIRDGENWRQVAASTFGEQGSWGNGAAMRAAPIGAFFGPNLELAAEQAERSAEVTHSHPEGIIGAVAVAIASAEAVSLSASGTPPSLQSFLGCIIDLLPQSEVRSKLVRAQSISKPSSLQFAIAVLGNGRRLSAPDTVPFALWCCSQHMDNYSEALWLAVSAGGDRDTICAIVGGVVASFVGTSGIPETWRRSRESLPAWYRNT
jgi:ADP-ribosylglycohydrolase